MHSCFDSWVDYATHLKCTQTCLLGYSTRHLHIISVTYLLHQAHVAFQANIYKRRGPRVNYTMNIYLQTSFGKLIWSNPHTYLLLSSRTVRVRTDICSKGRKKKGLNTNGIITDLGQPRSQRVMANVKEPNPKRSSDNSNKTKPKFECLRGLFMVRFSESWGHTYWHTFDFLNLAHTEGEDYE